MDFQLFLIFGLGHLLGAITVAAIFAAAPAIAKAYAAFTLIGSFLGLTVSMLSFRFVLAVYYTLEGGLSSIVGFQAASSLRPFMVPSGVILSCMSTGALLGILIVQLSTWSRDEGRRR